MRGFTFMVSHYNMNPGGWNGFSTLSDFYDKFQATDTEKRDVLCLSCRRFQIQDTDKMLDFLLDNSII